MDELIVAGMIPISTCFVYTLPAFLFLLYAEVVAWAVANSGLGSTRYSVSLFPWQLCLMYVLLHIRPIT
jgi:hypothetical protein